MLQDVSPIVLNRTSQRNVRASLWAAQTMLCTATEDNNKSKQVLRPRSGGLMAGLVEGGSGSFHLASKHETCLVNFFFQEGCPMTLSAQVQTAPIA